MKTFFNRYIALLPIVFLSIVWIFTCSKLLFFYGYLFPLPVYFAGFLLSVNAFVFFEYRRYYKYILGLTFILSNTSIARFTFYTYSAFFSVGGVKIHFIPTVFVAILLTYLFNFNSVNRLLARLFMNSSLSDEEFREIKSSTAYNDFLEKYNSFEQEKLLKIMNDERYIKEARDAAKYILQTKFLTENL